MNWKTIFLSLAACLFLTAGSAQAGPYLDSAHGNDGYGVLWTTDPFYPQGNCGHCHIQHNSIDGDMVSGGIYDPCNFDLFYDDYVSKSDLFCFECHRAADLGYGQVNNNPYCVNFGGYPEYYTSIKKQFTNDNSKPAACGSRHHLTRIRNRIMNQYTSWGFNDDADPCVACHPPHTAQRNYPPTTSGDLNTCIRLPSKYKSIVAADLLWGDDTGERMDDYASVNGGVYQPPYYGDTTSGKYEPTGTAVNYAGDRTPDYVTFCMECHVDSHIDPERDNETVKAIDWDHDIHGTAHANTCDSGGSFEGTLRAPYVDSPDSNYILSCLDCHEPHGARKRGHLIRRMINGEEVPDDSGSCDQYTDWAVICARCHDWPHPTWDGCETCHGSNDGFHGGDLIGMCTGDPGF